MARLAFETDSTRVVALLLDSVNSPAIKIGDRTASDGYHNLSHHGHSAAKLSELKAIDQWHMKLLAGLFSELESVKENGGTLLDQTMILLWHEPGKCRHPCDHQFAHSLGWRRFQTRPAPGF